VIAKKDEPTAAPKSRLEDIQFTHGDLNGSVACLGGPEAIAAARIFVGENGGRNLAVNGKYDIVERGPLPIAVFTVAQQEKMLDITFPPPGYEFAALGTRGTAELAAVSKRKDQTIEVSLFNLATGTLSPITEIPAPKGKTTTLTTHLYDRWLVTAYGDAIYMYDIRSARRVDIFKTANHAWIFAADLYGHLLYVRSVPFGEGSDKELPPLQIDLSRLAE
jgi:hypothetical protein